MLHYRYHALPKDGRAQWSGDLVALDDREAIDLIRIRREGADIELWRDDKKVALVPKDGPAMLIVDRAEAASLAS